MDKIKILMVLGNTGRGGSQAYVMNVLRNIDWNRFQVDIAACWNEDGGFHEEMLHLGCKIHIVPYFKVSNYFSYIVSWKKLLSKNHYDIVHAHATNSASVYLKIAKEYGCKTIAHSHSAGYRGTKIQQMIKKIFATGAKKYADYWYACSDKAAERLYGREYEHSKKYHSIPNAINAESYKFNVESRNKIRNLYGIDSNTKLFGHVGTFSAPKNHLFLLDIFNEILLHNPNSLLMLCGEGDLMPLVKECARNKGIYEKIIFTNNVENVNEHMMAMDVLVFPSIFEGLPVTIVEAQATGLSVIMSDVITDDVDLTKLVFRNSLKKTAVEWANSAIHLKSEDREAYCSIIAQSSFNMKTSIIKLMNLYTELLNND